MASTEIQTDAEGLHPVRARVRWDAQAKRPLDHPASWTTALVGTTIIARHSQRCQLCFRRNELGDRIRHVRQNETGIQSTGWAHQGYIFAPVRVMAERADQWVRMVQAPVAANFEDVDEF